MRNALLLIIASQCLWYIWGERTNSLYMSDVIGNAEYFWSTFIFAALIDFFCIQIIVSLRWTAETSKYMSYLVALLAASVGSHLVGCIGFWTDSRVMLQVYDLTSVFLLIAELGIFVGYGLDTLYRRGVGHRRANS